MSTLARFPSRRALLGGVAATLFAIPARTDTANSSLRTMEARAFGDQQLGFDGVAPGPLLRYKQGDELAVRFVNKLDQPATIHWHGLRGDSAMDGVAPLTQPAVAPGESFDYRRKLSEPGLFCYHPSVYGMTPDLMRRGLKGLLIVDELDPLPSDRELLLVLDDAPNTLTVNGAPAPLRITEKPGSRVRLRLANLASERIMIVSFSDVQPFVIAIDGQPCDAFEPVRKSIPVAPGARFELMFDMPKVQGETARAFLRGADGEESDLLIATTKGAKIEGRGLIYSLPQNPALPAEIPLRDALKIDLHLSQSVSHGQTAWTINESLGGYDGKPLFTTRRDRPVTLGFINHADTPLAMHVHGHALRLLHDLDDGWEPYWRNSVIVPARKTKHVSFVAESPGKWAIHDDIAPHEAAGLATWFETK